MAEEKELSLTTDIRSFLLAKPRESISSKALTRKPLDDMYSTAEALGLSLYELIQQQPMECIKAAEHDVAEWTRVMSEAALTGTIVVADAEGGSNVVKVNRQITDLLKTRVTQAHTTLESIMNYALSVTSKGTLRKDQVIQTLYNQAIVKGNVKALTYLIDRIEGRVGDANDKKYDYSNAYNVYKIVSAMFAKQLDVLNSGHGSKIVCCSRRAGKTVLAASTILINCLSQPNTTCMYIGKTMELAEDLLHKTMDQMIDDLQLVDSSGKRLNYKKFDNGSDIIVRGLSNTKDPDMIRGQKAKVVIIDEFFHMVEDGLLEYMIKEVLEPMQMDYANEYITMFIGTPPKVKGTYGEKMWVESTIPHFHWTYEDNPYPKGQDKRAFVEAKLQEKGLDWSSPYAQREYLGQFAYDEDALLYPVFHTYNPETYEPLFNVTSIYCGIDYGVSDSNAVVAVAWDDEMRQGFVFFESKNNRLQVDASMSMLDHLKREVKILWDMALDFFPSYNAVEANKRIYWSADSSDQQLTQELMYNIRVRGDDKLKLNIVNAHKVDKSIMQDKIRDLLRTGDLLLPSGSKIEAECEKTILKRLDNGSILPEVDDKYYHPDLLPALRYALWDAVGMEVVKTKKGIDDFMDGHAIIDHNNSGHQDPVHHGGHGK